MRGWVRSDKGNILIMMAGAMAVLAGFGILTIDIGRMLVTRSQLQNAADAGALAGASLFCSGTPTDAEVQDEVRLVGGANKALEAAATEVDIPNTQITIDRGENANDVSVRTESNTRQFLTGLFTLFQAADPDVSLNPSREAAVAAEATARCGGVCSVSCVKPWSIPDRWDDVTGVPGYMGDGPGRRPTDWRNDDHWNHEEFIDLNGNRLWDPGEVYVDLNLNARYDEEAYHPALTGYGPDPVPGNYLSPNGDIGLELVLHPYQGGAATPEPGQYWSVDLPPVNKVPDGNPPTGGDEYRENIAECNPTAIERGDWLQVKPGGMVGPTNQGMRDLIAQDPNAYWDDSTQSVQNSNFGVSPRIVLIPLHDPRIPIVPGRTTIQVTKVAAFFMEQMVGSAEVRGRFLKVRAAGSTCPDGQTSGFFVFNLSLIR